MISSTNLKIYKNLFSEKSIQEEYLGYLPIEWYYSKLSYTADWTEAIPFDLFDKTIVKVLLIEESLRIEDLGEILGMNLTDDFENQKYKDQAEYDILKYALDSLKNFEMIEIGDIYYSSCRLTKIGKEYAQKGKKFRTKHNKPFSIYIDNISNNYEIEKSFFDKLEGERILVDENNFITDEDIIKNIVALQLPSLQDIEQGHSIQNIVLNKNRSDVYCVQLNIALLLDFKTKEIRCAAFDKNGNKVHDYFSQWLNKNKIQDLVQGLNQLNQDAINSNLKAIPQKYIDKLIFADEQINIADNEDIIEVVKKSYQNLFLKDEAYIWNNLPELVEDGTTEILFLLPKYGKSEITLIQNLKNKFNQIKIYIIIENIKEDDENIKELHEESLKLDNLVYLIEVEKIPNFYIFINKDELCEISIQSFLIQVSELSVSKKYYLQKEVQQQKINNIKEAFAEVYLPMTQHKIENFQMQEHEVSQSYIEKLYLLDDKAKPFLDVFVEDKEIFNKIEKAKSDLINKAKQIHQEGLIKSIEAIYSDIENQNFTSLEELDIYKNKLSIVEESFFDDYNECKEKLQNAHKYIKKKEVFIKDRVLSKTFIIDTNVFIEDSEIILKIDKKHKIIISHTVIEELDKLKMNKELKKTASSALSIINKNLSKRIRTDRAKKSDEIYTDNSPDNRILSLANKYKENNPVLLTNDNGLQLKSKSLDIPAMSLFDFLNNRNVDVNEPENNEDVSSNKEIEYYKNIFLKLKSNKKGEYLISKFIKSIENNNPKFNYKSLGFNDQSEFVASIGIFEVIKKRFLKLK